jgi:succinate dehydrogenase hydrophobic anchor subunit
MLFLQSFFFVFLEWALAIPVILHTLNGGRLLLYEIFCQRNNDTLIRWMLSLSVIYVLLIGMFMVMGNQTVSPVLYWLCMLVISLALSYLIGSRIWHTGNSVGWKLQRITGGFLLIMIPAHLLFMHLQPSIGHEAVIVIVRMQHIFIKIIDLLLLFAGLYHAGYGVLAIVNDYLAVRTFQYTCTVLAVIVMGLLAWAGVKLTLFI